MNFIDLKCSLLARYCRDVFWFSPPDSVLGHVFLLARYWRTLLVLFCVPGAPKWLYHHQLNFQILETYFFRPVF